MTRLLTFLSVGAITLAATAALAESPLDEARAELDRLIAAERLSARPLTRDGLRLFALPVGVVSFGVGETAGVSPEPSTGYDLPRPAGMPRERAGR